MELPQSIITTVKATVTTQGESRGLILPNEEEYQWNKSIGLPFRFGR